MPREMHFTRDSGMFAKAQVADVWAPKSKNCEPNYTCN